MLATFSGTLMDPSGAAIPGATIKVVQTETGFTRSTTAAADGVYLFNFFTSRVEQFVIDMNDVSSEFIDYVLREGRA